MCGPLSLTLRGEYFADRDGARTGVSQHLAEATLTPELRLTPRMLVRADLRVDHSNREVFEKRDATARTQPTLLLDMIYAF